MHVTRSSSRQLQRKTSLLLLTGRNSKRETKSRECAHVKETHDSNNNNKNYSSNRNVT